MTENPVHSASQTVEMLRLHALLMAQPPGGADLIVGDDALEVVWSRVIGGEHGDEGLRITFPITVPVGIRHSIATDELKWFINPRDSTDEVIAARGPNPPFLEHLTTLRFEPGDDTIPGDLKGLPRDEWAEYIQSYLIEHPAMRAYSHREGLEICITDEDELDHADDLLSEPGRYFHWSRFDQHFVAEYDGAGCITISAVNFDDYLPAEPDELFEFVQADFTAWLDRARKVEYRYDHEFGWMFRLEPEEGWQPV